MVRISCQSLSRALRSLHKTDPCSEPTSSFTSWTRDMRFSPLCRSRKSTTRLSDTRQRLCCIHGQYVQVELDSYKLTRRKIIDRIRTIAYQNENLLECGWR